MAGVVRIKAPIVAHRQAGRCVRMPHTKAIKPTRDLFHNGSNFVTLRMIIKEGILISSSNHFDIKRIYEYY